ncbi:MAG TPA: type II secretion system protein [Candidatus Paceibacterota bacterium]|nr:type II secretion system protein [Candidatus Paceibacterota bacterium]
MIKGLTVFSKGHITGKKGFTLIELLVVIAIIGILAGIVLASLGTARTKGKDASAKESMSSLRTAAEIYYGGTGANSYGANSGATPTTVTSGGTVAGNGGVCNDTTVTPLEKASSSNAGQTLTCSVGVGGATYEAHVTLNDGTIFCVDSNGFSGTATSPTVGTASVAAKCQ